MDAHPAPTGTAPTAGGPPEAASLDEVLHATSRTFALGITLLPEPLREQVKVAYLVLRVSDFLEDNRSMEPARKVELLRLWHGVLHGEAGPLALRDELETVNDPLPDARAARRAADIRRALDRLDPDAREVVARHAGDSTLGMARWVERGPDFTDEDDLDDYMHEVAGRVGWLLTDLFALRVPAVAARREPMSWLGREFGLALQTVNVIRGLNEDWKRGWVYVPRSFLEGSGVAPGELVRGEAGDDALRRRVLDRLVEKSDRHLAAARRYVAGIPSRHHGIRLFCLLPLLFAVRTLAVSRGNLDVYRRETKIGRDEVRRIARAARWMGWSDAWVSWYCRRLGGR